jgi:hypothetical protein
MKIGLEKRRSKKREKQKQKRKALRLYREKNKQLRSFINPLDAMPKSFDIPPFFSSEPLVVVCFGEEDEHGNPIEYDMMALSTEEFNAKLENMGKGAK